MRLSLNEYAIYMPAVNSSYADSITRLIPEERYFSHLFSIDDLAFWKPSSKLWHHAEYLYSIGQHAVGSNPDNSVTRSGRTYGFLMGDSGGYQLGKGKLAGIPNLKRGLNPSLASSAWRDAHEAKYWIVSWLDTYTHLAMTIDIPLWSLTDSGKKSAFHKCSKQQIIKLTNENLQFIELYRQNKTRWLNVIQGNDEAMIREWWNAVKWFECSGYALGGNSGWRGGLSSLLKTVLMIRDEGKLGPGHDWIHMLGSSTNKLAVVLTAVQKNLREHVNPLMQLSFDSASPFLLGGRYEKYAIAPKFGKSMDSWRFNTHKYEQSRFHVKSTDPLPFSSPIADRLTLGDMSVKSGMFDRSCIDTFTNLFLINHNIWIYLNGMRRANDIVFNNKGEEVPLLIRDCIKAINLIMDSNDWRTTLSSYEDLFSTFDKA